MKDVSVVIAFLKPHTDQILVNEPENKGDSYYDPTVKLISPLNICVKGVDEKLADELVRQISSLPSVSIHKISSHFEGKVDINVTHAQATKQHGVLQVAELLNIDPKEMIGVGDGYNDFPLLMACGLKVAMGNAVDDLKAIADYIAPSVNDDGLADVIEKFVLYRK